MSKADDAKSLVQRALDKALAAQQTWARESVERWRRVNPDDTPQELIRRSERSYLSAVTKDGAAFGKAAIASDAGFPTAQAHVEAFTEASVFYLLSLAEVHGLHPEDVEGRERLVTTVLLSDRLVRWLNTLVEHTGPYWARHIVDAIPMSAINRANKILGPRFITKYGTEQGVLVLGKQVPLGVGAVLGAGGSLLLGRLVIKSARGILGQPPANWPDDGTCLAE